jgi:hypothetical protein
MAQDFSDVILGSVIQRSFETTDLVLTTFMICHALLLPEHTHMGPIKVHNNVTEMWTRTILKFKETVYDSAGARQSIPAIFCRISNTKERKSYVVEGLFLPNRLTPDRSSNRRLDILQCNMQGSQSEYYSLARSGESVFVEILKGNISIVNFTVPWETRRTGFMLTLPAYASHFDAWRGIRSLPDDARKHKDDNKEPHKLYICAPGLETPASALILPLYLEFVQHHLLLGVDHIFLSASFGWESEHMIRLLQIFRSYIEEGKVSISSQTDQGVDYLHSFTGVYWQRNVIKIAHINSFLYLAKGTADYLGVWDMDEFFIPRKPFTSIIEVIRSLESPVPIPAHPSNLSAINISSTWKPGRGLADGDGHPFCFILLTSRVILKYKNDLDKKYDLWLGERFPQGDEASDTKITIKMGFKKSILPTRNIFQAGIHMSGGCHLPRPFNGCRPDEGINGKCYNIHGIPRPRRRRGLKQKELFHLDHRFDEEVFDRDNKHMDPDTEGIIYHYYSTHRHHFSVEERPPSDEAKTRVNEYTSRFFIPVMRELQRRDLVKYVSLPFNISYLLSVLPKNGFIESY